MLVSLPWFSLTNGYIIPISVFTWSHLCVSMSLSKFPSFYKINSNIGFGVYFESIRCSMTRYRDPISKYGHISRYSANVNLAGTLFSLANLLLLFFKLFIFGCAGSSLLHDLFSSCGEQGLLCNCGEWASRCGGFSCCRAWASVVAAYRFSSCSSWTPEHRLNICSAWA